MTLETQFLFKKMTSFMERYQSIKSIKKQAAEQYQYQSMYNCLNCRQLVCRQKLQVYITESFWIQSNVNDYHW